MEVELHEVRKVALWIFQRLLHNDPLPELPEELESRYEKLKEWAYESR